MKTNILMVLIGLFAVISCSTKQGRNKQSADLASKAINDSLVAAVQSNTRGMDSQIIKLETMYQGIVKELYDSVSRHKSEYDFSDLTEGIEKRYAGCENETEKMFMGYQLAKNYYIHFDGSKKDIYKQKAEPLFYSFLNFKNGEFASLYLKLEIKKIHYIKNKWNNFTEQDKGTIMFYGLLRGFGNGLPDVLKNVE